MTQAKEDSEYLSFVSARCSVVRKELKETTRSINKTQRQYSKAVERIDKVCQVKIEELKRMGLYDIPETKPNPLNDFVVGRKTGNSKNVKLATK